MYVVIDKMISMNFMVGNDCFDNVFVYVVGEVNVDGFWDVYIVNCIFVVLIDDGSQGFCKSLFVGFGVVIVIIVLIIVCGVGCGVWQYWKEIVIYCDFVMCNNSMLYLSGFFFMWFKWMDIKFVILNFLKEIFLGEGSYGSVYKVIFKDGCILVVK